jgi:hypothetical protein
MAKINLNPDVFDIVSSWLTEHGFDGLYCPGECSCTVQDGISPCGSIEPDCIAGYRHQGKTDSEYDFTVGPYKEKKESS